MRYSSIVCAVTGSFHSEKAAVEAARLAREHGAKLVFVYAVDTDFLRGGITSASSVEDSLEHVGSHILKAAEDIAAAQGVTPKKVLRKGPVLEVIKQVISEENADLLILGHEERSFFEKILLRGDVEDHIQELRKETGVEVRIIREEETGDL